MDDHGDPIDLDLVRLDRSNRKDSGRRSPQAFELELESGFPSRECAIAPRDCGGRFRFLIDGKEKSRQQGRDQDRSKDGQSQREPRPGPAAARRPPLVAPTPASLDHRYLFRGATEAVAFSGNEPPTGREPGRSLSARAVMSTRATDNGDAPAAIGRPSASKYSNRNPV
jgi:hypothetical protein